MLIRTISFSFSIIDSPLMPYFALVRPKLEYISVTLTLLWLLIPINLIACNIFFQDIRHHYNNLLKLKTKHRGL
jgi:hypothetical protein